MTVEFNMEIAVRNIIACRRRAKPQDVAHGIAVRRSIRGVA